MQLKKITAIFLAVVLMLCLPAVYAGAENTELFKVDLEAVITTSTVSSTPIIYNQGDEITVRIRASQNTGITSLKLYIDYDENLLEVEDGKYKTFNLFTDKDILTAHTTSEGDGYLIFYSEGYPNVSTETGNFAEITFKVKNICSEKDVISVRLFQNSAGNCAKQTISGLVTVPFASEAIRFAVHDINVFDGTVTVPTCTENGYTTYVCKACRKNIVGNTVLAEGHDLVHHEAQEATHTQVGWAAYEDCVNCDYTTYVEIPEIPYLVGDVNGDEAVTDGDAIYLLYSIFNGEKYPLNQDADFDGDGLVTDADAVYLLYSIFNPSKYPLETR